MNNSKNVAPPVSRPPVSRRPVSRRRDFNRAIASVLLAAVLSPASPVLSAPAATPDLSGKKTLIVYYSWGGNTRQLVSHIQGMIQADVVELHPVDPYPEEYRLTTVQAKAELEAGHRPPLSNSIDTLNDYDVIIIGSPNWWGSVAVPVFTFLETYDLSGKTVGLCLTHEGSRLGRARDDVGKLCPGAILPAGLAIRGSRVGSSQGDVAAWLRETGLGR